MNVITEVVYSNEDKVTSAYFTSNEQYMEWRENYPEYEVLEILDDFVDDINNYITPSEINAIIASLPVQVQRAKISYDATTDTFVANGKAIKYPVRVTALSYCTGEVLNSIIPDKDTIQDLMVDEWCLFQNNE